MVISPSEAKKCFDENQKEKIDYSLATEIINQIDSLLKKNPKKSYLELQRQTYSFCET